MKFAHNNPIPFVNVRWSPHDFRIPIGKPHTHTQTHIVLPDQLWSVSETARPSSLSVKYNHIWFAVICQFFRSISNILGQKTWDKRLFQSAHPLSLSPSNIQDCREKSIFWTLNTDLREADISTLASSRFHFNVITFFIPMMRHISFQGLSPKRSKKN